MPVMLDVSTEVNAYLYFVPGSHNESNIEPEINNAKRATRAYWPEVRPLRHLP